MDIIENCLITNSDAKILKQYCVSKSDPLYKQYRGYNTSIVLSGNTIFSMYSGKVVMISGDSKDSYQVVVQMNKDQAIRYGNLKTINVSMNQNIDVGQTIGQANKFVNIEYLTTFIQNPFSFRIKDTLLYKDDPIKLFNDTSLVSNTSSIQFDDSGLQGSMDEYDGGVPVSSEYILSNNRGD